MKSTTTLCPDSLCLPPKSFRSRNLILLSILPSGFGQWRPVKPGGPSQTSEKIALLWCQDSNSDEALHPPAPSKGTAVGTKLIRRGGWGLLGGGKEGGNFQQMVGVPAYDETAGQGRSSETQLQRSWPDCGVGSMKGGELYGRTSAETRGRPGRISQRLTDGVRLCVGRTPPIKPSQVSSYTLIHQSGSAEPSTKATEFQ